MKQFREDGVVTEPRGSRGTRTASSARPAGRTPSLPLITPLSRTAPRSCSRAPRRAPAVCHGGTKSRGAEGSQLQVNGNFRGQWQFPSSCRPFRHSSRRGAARPAQKMPQHLLDNLTPQQLCCLLEDTQSSLSTALARVEAYRLQNSKLKNEVAQLRQQVHRPVAGAQPGSGQRDSLAPGSGSGSLHGKKTPSLSDMPAIAFPHERDAVRGAGFRSNLVCVKALCAPLSPCMLHSSARNPRRAVPAGWAGLDERAQRACVRELVGGRAPGHGAVGRRQEPGALLVPALPLFAPGPRSLCSVHNRPAVNGRRSPRADRAHKGRPRAPPHGRLCRTTSTTTAAHDAARPPGQPCRARAGSQQPLRPRRPPCGSK
jgi:hypothetical protein